MDCPRCEATGLCADCHGQGSVECPACRGSGSITTSRGQHYPCRSCAGKGRLECSKECPSCEGSGQITSALQRKIRDKYQVRWDNTAPLQAATSVLIGLNFLVFVLQISDRSGVGQWIARWGNDSLALVLSGQVWRLVTPIFLHAGWVHLLLNCWFLWSYCPQLEGLYGTRRFLVLYLVSGVVGNLFSCFGNCYLGGSYWAGIGASTSLMGVAAAFLGLHWRWGLFESTTIRVWWIYLFLFGLAGLVLRSYFPLDNWGHLGGFVGGLLLALLLPRPTGH